jgi:hypothetical protein
MISSPCPLHLCPPGHLVPGVGGGRQVHFGRGCDRTVGAAVGLAAVVLRVGLLSILAILWVEWYVDLGLLRGWALRHDGSLCLRALDLVWLVQVEECANPECARPPPWQCWLAPGPDCPLPREGFESCGGGRACVVDWRSCERGSFCVGFEPLLFP